MEDIRQFRQRLETKDRLRQRYLQHNWYTEISEGKKD